jgi:chromate reductase, NAD(P)H dehydrogenase (quinone)
MQSIVAISGTSRPNNYTSRALAVVVRELEARGATVTTFDARNVSLGFPGMPTTDDAKRLQDAVRNSTAVVLASPEYHGSFAAMTKLILENMGFPSAIKSKPLALLGVAQGRIGAVKSLEQLRSVCSHMGAIVLPMAISIAGVQQIWDERGELADESARTALRQLSESLLEFVKTYVCPKHELEALVRSGPIESWTTVV